VSDRFQLSNIEASESPWFTGQYPQRRGRQAQSTGSMARNHDWNYGDSDGAEYYTKWLIRKETLHEDAAGVVDRTDDSRGH
jgi:hypothetical protein